MPRIDDAPVKEKRPFKKKAYRPWNLMDDEFAIAPKEALIADEEKVIEKEPISNQLGTDKKSISNQIVNEIIERVTELKPISNPTSNPISNQIHGVAPHNKAPVYIDHGASALIQRVSGLQRKILFHIVGDCILNGSLSTSPISTESLKQLTNTDKDTIKTATQRLINKNLISRGYGKKGKGGFAIFCITEEIRNAVIDAQRRGNDHSELVTNWISNKEPLSTYSSNINNYITTTSLPEEWKKINFESLEHIGFSETQLRQLFDSNMTSPDIVQDSINRFAYSLQYSDKAKAYSDPLNVLMGVLRKGQRWNEANYVEPKELALRQMVEEARKRKEQQDVLVKELIELEFPEWRRNLTDEQVNQIVPADVRKTGLSAAIQASLRTYFTEHVVFPRIAMELQ